MKKLSIAIALLFLTITGCTKSSGVMEYSPDVYAVSVDVDSEIYGLATAKKKAFNEAKNFCGSKNKILSVESTDGISNSYGYTTATILFRCVAE